MAEDLTYEPEPGASLATRADVRSFPTGTAIDPISLRDTTFAKIATKPVPKKSEKILLAPLDPEVEIDILPSGEIYMGQVHVRRRLNKAFGPMGWALRPLTLESVNSDIAQMYQRFALVASGRVVATAVGSAKYYPTNRDGKPNARMDYADVAESIKSNALTRCCKDLGIGSECWDRNYAEAWKNKYAVHVWVKEKDRKDRSGTTAKIVDYWRRVNYKPFVGEIEPCKDSPNQPAWRAQMEAWIAMVNDEHAKTKQMRERIAAAKKTRGDEAEPSGEPKNTSTDANGGESAQARNVTEQSDPKPAGNQDGAQQPTSHAKPSIDVRRLTIRECKIHLRGAKNAKGEYAWILYKIVMMDGHEYFTFSKTIYGKMQQHFASRDKIEISEEMKETGGKNYRHITEWTVVK